MACPGQRGGKGGAATGVARGATWCAGVVLASGALAGDPAPARLLLLDFGVGKAEGRHAVASTQAPGSRVVAEVLPASGGGVGSVALFEGVLGGRPVVLRLPELGREGEATVLCRVLERAGVGGTGPGVDGRWRVVSRGQDGAVHRLGWEWWSDGMRLAGRLDPDTDYRFAHLERGTNEAGRVAFAVQYIQDRYELWGDATARGWAGAWRKAGQEEAGTWTAERVLVGEMGAGAASLPPAGAALALRRWVRRPDGATWVGLGEDAPPGEGWDVDAELGRAWRWHDAWRGRPARAGAGPAGASGHREEP